MHITKCVFQYCLLLCVVLNFSLISSSDFLQCQGLPLAFWKDVKELHYWFPRLVRFNFLSYYDALLIEMKGSLEACERRVMSVCLLPHACLPWSQPVSGFESIPCYQVAEWLCSSVCSCARLAWGGIRLAESSRAASGGASG